MSELSKEQIEKRNYYYHRIKGRQAICTNPYYTTLKKDETFQIMNYLEENNTFKVLGHTKGNYEYCLADEFQLVDKEFSDFKIIKKGIRVERKDKFGDRFMVELQNNKRDIYLSSALVSLLNFNNEENYVGFATDPESGFMYIFNADKASGYLLNKDNNRITSIADWREMFKLYETMNFEITPQPIIDNNNPGFIFFTVRANYESFDNKNTSTAQTKKQPIKINEHQLQKGQIRHTDKGILNAAYTGDNEAINEAVNKYYKKQMSQIEDVVLRRPEPTQSIPTNNVGYTTSGTIGNDPWADPILYGDPGKGKTQWRPSFISLNDIEEKEKQIKNKGNKNEPY